MSSDYGQVHCINREGHGLSFFGTQEALILDHIQNAQAANGGY